MEQYQTGTGTQNILLTVDISTLGLAATRAILVDLNSSATGISVASSHDASGDIPSTSIGKAGDICNRRLSIITKIDLLGDDAASRQREFENLRASYEIRNGAAGVGEFTKPEKKADVDFKTGYLYMHIDLHP